MSSRRILITSVAAALGLTLAPNLIQQAQAVDLIEVHLHNNTAGVADCPADVVGDAWHFVAPPKSSTDFVHITLVLHNSVTDVDDTVVIPDETWISEPLQGDAYVLVPPPYTIDSLVGGTFIITGSDKDVRLSHTCGGGGEQAPPDVTVSKTANVTYDQDFVWTIDKRIVSVIPHTTTADVNYAIDVTKTGPFTVSGSYEVTGTITVKNDSADASVADIVDLSDALDVTAATCTLDDPFVEVVLAPGESQDYDYTCTGIAGIPTGSDTNTATATVHFGLQDFPATGTANVDFDAATVDQTTDATATLTDPVLGITSSYSASGTQFGTKWGLTAGGTNCDPGFTNTATVTEDDSKNSASDSVTVKVCTTVNGHTIGFWFASPQGNAQTLVKFPILKTAYPNILNMALTSMNTSAKIKNFGSGANCSGTCTTMLQAQFIATAMSNQTVSGFGAQCVYVPTYVDASGMSTISNLLNRINTLFPGLTTAQRIELKTLLDAINNNLTLACI
jgi:hypothetical protein